ncbi:MAG: hypothetical protein WA947_00960 [Phormidesmis sp.]
MRSRRHYTVIGLAQQLGAVVTARQSKITELQPEQNGRSSLLLSSAIASSKLN